MPEVVDRMADLDPRQLIWGSPGSILKEKAIKAECLAEEKMAKIGSLQSVLRKEEFISVRLKAALALEEERKKKVEIKVVELEARMVKSISEAMTWAMEEFKAFQNEEPKCQIWPAGVHHELRAL
ncbi:hypothetical protein COCNU_scaffold005100G000010 [Cocos nucifera]|nr:hypothetical protein [Cocos nucifera]